MRQRESLQVALRLRPRVFAKLALRLHVADAPAGQIAARILVGRGGARGARAAEQAPEPALAAGDAEQKRARAARGEARAGLARGRVHARAARHEKLSLGRASSFSSLCGGGSGTPTPRLTV